jgi:hypothetical protein
MVHALVVEQHFDIWDVVVEMKSYFNMSEKEAIDRLTPEHQELIRESALNRKIK